MRWINHGRTKECESQQLKTEGDPVAIKPAGIQLYEWTILPAWPRFSSMSIVLFKSTMLG